MEYYVIDANIFFNMEANLNLGKNTEEVARYISCVAQKAKEDKKALFYIPPRIVEEFLSFFEDKNQPFIQELIASLVVKSPDISKIQLSSDAFYLLIEEIRKRSYRGLTIGEEEIKKAGRLMMGKKDLEKKEFEMGIGPVTKTFRDRYRQATRHGFLDSLADLDLLMLAKETEGHIVSADEGVVSWGRVFGVKELPAGAARKTFDALL